VQLMHKKALLHLTMKQKKHSNMDSVEIKEGDKRDSSNDVIDLHKDEADEVKEGSEASATKDSNYNMQYEDWDVGTGKQNKITCNWGDASDNDKVALQNQTLSSTNVISRKYKTKTSKTHQSSTNWNDVVMNKNQQQQDGYKYD